MVDFSNGMVILGAISFIILPFILKIKTLYKVIFILCGLLAILTTFFKSSDFVNIIATISLLIPFVISGIKKDNLFKEKKNY